ncbi:MAG TPA: exosortase K [Pyrinomonadaceae bacterium]|nr:exosortase K [Pyrinomonadaceae bacterium]
MRAKAIWGAQLTLVLLCALALKYFYSTASVNDLRWILAPTTLLVELLSGKSFEFESYMGYMSSDHTFVIAAPCAGVNFLLTAFVMLALRRLWRERFQAINWSFLPVTAVIAYAATLIANTVRIVVALYGLELSWLTRNQVHRLEGIVVYFGFLLLLFVVIERFESAKSSVKRLALPLLIYYATTLGIPLVNGAYRQYASFWEHFLFVLVLPLLLVLPSLLIHAFSAFIRGSRGVASDHAGAEVGVLLEPPRGAGVVRVDAF